MVRGASDAVWRRRGGERRRRPHRRGKVAAAHGLDVRRNRRAQLRGRSRLRAGRGQQQEGDGKTPEGKYVIEGRNPSSAFHLSLKISYPDAADRAAAAARNVSPGGDISFTVRPTGGCWRASRPAIGPAAASP